MPLGHCRLSQSGADGPAAVDSHRAAQMALPVGCLGGPLSALTERHRCMYLHCELVLETIGKSGVGHSVCWQQRVDVPGNVKLCTLACVAQREEPKYPGRINSESMFRAMCNSALSPALSNTKS